MPQTEQRRGQSDRPGRAKRPTQEAEQHPVAGAPAPRLPREAEVVPAQADPARNDDQHHSGHRSETHHHGNRRECGHKVHTEQDQPDDCQQSSTARPARTAGRALGVPDIRYVPIVRVVPEESTVDGQARYEKLRLTLGRSPRGRSGARCPILPTIWITPASLEGPRANGGADTTNDRDSRDHRTWERNCRCWFRRYGDVNIEQEARQ